MTADLDALLAAEPITPASLSGAVGRPAPRIANPEVARRNRNNRKRGKGTSADLATYLGPKWQNVEGMNWPWDVQSHTARIQSKRDALARGPIGSLRLIDYIPEGDYLRGLYHVEPNKRLTSGDVTFRLEEWVQWYGWKMPTFAVLSVGVTVPLVKMPLPVFAEVAA